MSDNGAAALRVNQFGFEWGPLEVIRVCDDRRGATISVVTKRGVVDITVTPKGFVRIHDRTKGGKLWQKNSPVAA